MAEIDVNNIEEVDFDFDFDFDTTTTIVSSPEVMRKLSSNVLNLLEVLDKELPFARRPDELTKAYRTIFCCQQCQKAVENHESMSMLELATKALTDTLKEYPLGWKR